MTIVLTRQGPVDVPAEMGDDGALWLSAQDTEAVSGWAMKPEGLCRGEICMPVPSARADEFVRDGRINLAAFWRRMNKPQAHNRNGDVWVFGEAAEVRAAAMESLDAPDFSLPDLDGNLHGLAAYRGRKVLLVSWASW